MYRIYCITKTRSEITIKVIYEPYLLRAKRRLRKLKTIYDECYLSEVEETPEIKPLTLNDFFEE